MSRRTHYAIVASGLAFAFALTGCSSGTGGGGDKDTPSVATLQSGAASAAATADQRPIYPADASYEQIGAMARPWLDCLKKEGVKKPEGALGWLQKGGGVQHLEGTGVSITVYKVCEPKQPESSEDHLLRTDPTEFKDNQREWYRCAQAAGYKLTAPDPETGEFGITEVGPNGDFGSEKMTECRRKAFAN